MGVVLALLRKHDWYEVPQFSSPGGAPTYPQHTKPNLWGPQIMANNSACLSVFFGLWGNERDCGGGRLVAIGNHCAVDIRLAPDAKNCMVVWRVEDKEASKRRREIAVC